MTPGECLRKAADILTDIMPKMIADVVGDGNQLPERVGILMASMLRARQSMDAIVLLTNTHFAEEAWAVLRPLAELVVNASYLQFATEEELGKFLLYDALAIGSFLEKFEKATGQSNHGFDEDDRKRMKNISDYAKDNTGLTEKDHGWTRLTVFDRAMRIDKEVGGTVAYRGFAKSVYQLAHPFVHSNMQSIQYHWMLLTGEEPGLEDQRHAEYDKPLIGAVQCLFLLALFVNDTKKLSFEPQITLAGRMLEFVLQQP